MGSRDRQQGSGRDAAQKRPEQKLYALESVVDRGFEDVTDDSDESVTRRVHWTIVKRTVADQKSSKAMSALYVLQREGVESEFPNLGAARAAVNKTIVHPEKLTLSKAEHAAAKSDR
jgi:CHASE2 domain-containing sensor protein